MSISKIGYIFTFLVFFLLRIWGINFGLPYDGLHPTENFSISQSLKYLTTANLRPANFQHPTLFQYLITLFASILFIPVKNYLYFYLLGRLISCLASCVCVYLLYLIAGELVNSKIFALLCACFLGFNLLSIKYAHYAVPDSLSSLFIVASILYSLRILKTPSLKNYLICSLFIGLSIASKFSGLISLGFLACAYLSSPYNKKTFRQYKFWFSLLIIFLVFFAVSPYHIIYLKESMKDYYHYFFERGYFTPSNFKTSGLIDYLVLLLPNIFGVLALIFSLLGLGIMFLKDKRKALFLFAPIFMYFLIIGRENGGILQNLLPLLPVLSIFAAYFFSYLKEKKINRTIIIFLATLVLLPNLSKAVIFDYLLLKPDTRILAQDWLMRDVEKGAKIGFERYTPYDLNYRKRSDVSKRFNTVYFVPSLSLYPASFYKEQGYDYIVTSSFRVDSYKFFCENEGTCEELKNYASYDSELKPVAIFVAPRLLRLTAVPLPWGTWPHQPTIKIYKVKK